MKLPSVTKKFWIIIISISVVAAFLAFYLLIYVKDREAHMVAKNYRALNRLGKNILGLKSNYAVSIKRFNDGMARYRGDEYVSNLMEQDADFIKQGIFPCPATNHIIPIDSIELTWRESAAFNPNHFHISTADFLARSNWHPFPLVIFFSFEYFI